MSLNVRKKAYQALHSIFFSSSFIKDPFLKILSQDMDDRDRALFTELVYGVTRNALKLDFYLNRILAKGLKGTDEKTALIMRMGAYELLFCDRIPHFATVHEHVDLASEMHGKKPLVNAVLRELLRRIDKLSLPDDFSLSSMSVRLSMPEWMLETFLRDLKLKTDQESEILLSSFNSVPQATFRCNTFRISREDLIESLKKDSIKAHATAYSPDGLIVTNGNPFKTKSFTEGLFIPQDEASQLITHFLDPAQDSRILDLCCGSGIKTSHLVALTEKKSHIVSVDLTRKKIESAKNLMKKLFETDVPVLFEKKNAASDLQYGEFDFVMIDAPCSGLGTLRRRPDMRIKKIKPDLRTLSDLQYRILLNAARHVKKAGVLLYAVCTVTQEETFEIVKRFLKETKGRFVVEPVRKEFMSPFISKHGFLIINPLKHDMDGFFAARFRNVFERT